MVVGTNVGVYLATALCTHKLRQLGAAHRADLYSVLLLTPLLLVFAEIIPKSLYQRRANTLMCRTVWPLAVSEVVFYPISRSLRWLSSFPQRLFRSGWVPGQSLFTFERFYFLLSEGTARGILSPYQKTMAENILSLKSRSITHAVVPLARVTTISQSAGVQDLMGLMAEHRFSRIPVCSGDNRRIVGIVNILDVVCNASREPSIPELAREPHFLSAQMSVAEALYSLKGARQQMGVVLDQRENPIGIVTIKDLVEEIVGELRAW
jgi:CBS domain containing-hemolysin-like protein